MHSQLTIGITLPDSTFCQGYFQELLCYGFYRLQKNSLTWSPFGSACGTKHRKRSTWKRDQASATLFSQPEICLAENATLFFKHYWTKNLRSSIISGHFDVCTFTIETTASLSVRTMIFLPLSDVPHRTMDATIGNKILSMVSTACVTLTQATSPETIAWQKLPNPISPLASMTNCSSSQADHTWSGMIETPLNSFKNRSHIFKSVLVPTSA